MKLVSTHTLNLILLFILIELNAAQAQVWSLQQCIDTAQVHNKSLQMNRNTISIGEQKEKEAKANLLPKITVNTDYKYFSHLPYQLMPLSTFNPTAPEGQFKEAQFGVPHNINANLQLSMPLYNPQAYGAIQTTRIAAELTELHYQKTEEQLFFDISNLYYNAQILYSQLAFIETNLLNSERLLKNIQLLNEQLLAKGTDISKVKLQIAQLTTQKENISSKYEQVLHALKFAMGVSIELKLQIDPNIQFQNANEYSNLSTLDIRMIKTQKRLLSSELNTLNKSRFLPTLNLTAMYGTTGFGYNRQANSFLNFYPIGFAGVQLSYPLFNGTITQRKIHQKTVELKNNELQFALISEQNNMQVQNSLMQRKSAKNSVETIKGQIELANNIYNQTIILKSQGTASLTDVLLADNVLRDAQQTYLAAIIDYLKIDLELKKLTGNTFINK